MLEKRAEELAKELVDLYTKQIKLTVSLRKLNAAIKERKKLLSIIEDQIGETTTDMETAIEQEKGLFEDDESA